MGFILAWKQVDNIADLRGKMPELRDNVLSGRSLPEVYTHLGRFAYADGL